MTERTEFVLIYATFPSAADAEIVGEALVSQRLAACVNIIPGMTSIYEWEGRLERSAEVIMAIKTRAAEADTVKEAIAARHSYSNPAIVILPIVGGAQPYLDWMRQQTMPA